MNERGGYSLYRVQKVITPPAADAAKVAAFSDRVGDQVGRELMTEYLASLRARADVKINEAALEKDQSGAAPQQPRLPGRRRP